MPSTDIPTKDANSAEGESTASNADNSSKTEGKGVQQGQEESKRTYEEPRLLKIFASAKNNIEAAKGQNCVMHPWRPAYSLCERCKRPFCYADLVKYEANLYCLEDIDVVSGGRTEKPVYRKNIFSYLAGLFFMLNAAIFGYFTYPTASFVVDGLLASLSQVAFYSFMSTYFFQTMNLFLTLLSFLSAITILATYRRGFGFGLVMGIFTLMVSSYEYLNSSISYLLLVTAIAVSAIALLIYSRMSSVSVKAAEEKIEPNDIEWPKPEVF